jgi:hypothetical protein
VRFLGGNARAGFRITIFDNRMRGDSSKPRLERVVVAGEAMLPCAGPESSHGRKEAPSRDALGDGAPGGYCGAMLGAPWTALMPAPSNGHTHEEQARLGLRAEGSSIALVLA